jgi:hypothetical protein
MKKITLLTASITLCIATFSSCKKDYNCSCTSTNNGLQTTFVQIIPGATKSEASTICKAGEVYAKGGTKDTECKLD